VADGKDGLYTREAIYKYMDGAGELYREYDYRELFVRRLLKAGEPPIIVELFDMGSDVNAFGVFSHSRDGPEAGIGQDSDYRAGLLCFWKGRFFTCIRAENETPDAKKAVLELGAGIAAAIKETGQCPRLLNALPTEGLIAENVRYFHKHTCLNYHYFVSDDNILNLGPETEAVLAPYRQPGGRYYLLLVKYPTHEAAKVALDSFQQRYLSPAEKHYIPGGREWGLARTENGKWAGAKRAWAFIAVVFDAASEELAEARLQTVAASLNP
jgi:hypothetical protein